MGKTRMPGWMARYACNLALLLLVLIIPKLCRAQGDAVVCRDGVGSFAAVFRNSVSVQVGAARNEGLATRVCEGSLGWGNKFLQVAPAAAQVDIDGFGIDLGLGTPV